MRILVANRGEIARRIIRTARRLGHATTAVASVHDRNAPHACEADHVVYLDVWDQGVSYLNDQWLLEAALAGPDTADRRRAVHPGYGFLAENAEFAQAVIDAGLIWIGPRPEVIELMGSKINARAVAERAGVPLIPGYAESQDDADLAAAADRIGYPVLVKASAGGGGKGIRIAHSAADFNAALSEARAESARSFGDDQVIVERYIQRPRHVEVQIIGDKHGNVRHLGTRECSVQRRYQKVFEEAPAPNLPDATREGLHEAAVKLASAVSYDSAGTVEFVVDDETGDYFFLEMNTRLQVEHPVTEEITGVDLVEWMIAVALGAPLSSPQENLRFQGHALEARILAEDPGAGFMPQIGTVRHVVIPTGVRWDAAVEPGTEITPHYDSMIAKLVVHADSRDAALAKMRTTLDEMIVGGVTTSAGLHRWLLDQPELIAGRITTRFLDEADIPTTPEPAVAAAAALWQQHLDGEQPSTVWHQSRNFSLTGRQSQHAIGVQVGGSGGDTYEVPPGVSGPDTSAAVVDPARREISINIDGHTQFFTMPTRSERWVTDNALRAATGDALIAPFPAVVAEVHVAPGDQVAGDQVLVVIEAMKMLHSLKSSGAATIDQVPVAVGDQVSTNQPLVTFTQPEQSEEKS